MIVDAHTHIFSDTVLQQRAEYAERDRWFGLLNPAGSRRLASPARLIRTMDEVGVDVAFVLSFGWFDHALCVEQNDCVLAAARQYPGRLLPFCTVQPRAGAACIAEVERVARLGCRGIGELFPDGQDFSLDDPAVMVPLLEACDALGLALLVHGSEPLGRIYPGKGETTPNRLFALARLARSVAPSLPIICAHLGGGLPFYELMPEVAEVAPQLYYDTGAAAYIYDSPVLAHVASIAPQRVLFGSDFPVIRLQRMIEYARSAELPTPRLAALMGGNAARLMGLGAAAEPRS